MIPYMALTHVFSHECTSSMSGFSPVITTAAALSIESRNGDYPGSHTLIASCPSMAAASLKRQMSVMITFHFYSHICPKSDDRGSYSMSSF